MTTVVILVLLWLGSNALLVVALILRAQRRDRLRAKALEAVNREYRELVSTYRM